MSRDDRDKWDRRYRDGAYAERRHPTALLVEWLPLVPAGPALDIACGAGRNALYLASCGRAVDAVDISGAALERGRQAAAERGLEIRFIDADLESDPDGALPPGPYALILVVRYVHRGLLPALARRLQPGGVLLVEQHVDSAAPVVGPATPAYRMRPQELLKLARAAGAGSDEIRVYREGLVTDPDGRTAALAQLVLEKRNS